MNVATKPFATLGRMIVAVVITIVNVDLNASAQISVDAIDSDGNVHNHQVLGLSGEDYQGWNDDAFIVDYVLGKLGLERA